MKTHDQILKDYNRYIQTVAMRMGQPQYTEDLIQIGRIAALQAYSRLDETKIKNDEKSYITTCIKGSMKNFLTDNARTIKIPAYKQGEVHISTLSINTPVGDEGSTVEDFIASSEDYIPLQPNEKLREALTQLKPKYKTIITMYFDLEDNSQPKTLREIAVELGMSFQAVNQQLKLAITKLKKEMTK
jgi:RNA polymerase sigma factor (sigma-70 family)